MAAVAVPSVLRRRARGAALLSALLALSGCGGAVVVLHNSETGETAQCNGIYPGQKTPSPDTDICIRDYESRGFLPVGPGGALPTAPARNTEILR